MPLTELVEQIHENALSKLEQSKSDFVRFYNEAPPEVVEFVELFLTWFADRGEKRQWAWEMFHRAFSFDTTSILGELHSFAVNCLLDDSGYKIDWIKPAVDEKQNLIWDNSSRGFAVTPCAEQDENTLPEVRISNEDDNSQCVARLIGAMRTAERRHQEEQRAREEIGGF